MPANLTPEFLAARERFHRSKTLEEKLEALQEMLATIPKHKGTEKMQADIRQRIAKLREQMEQARRSGKGGGPSYHVDREGAAQIVLLGPPNAGKSSILAALTNATPVIAPYPYSTLKPLPGMMEYEDVQIQLVDPPPITPDSEGWVYGLIRMADAVALVGDLANPSWRGEVEEVLALLESRHIRLTAGPSRQVDWRKVEKRTVAVGMKLDLGEAQAGEFLAWCQGRFPGVAASTVTGAGLEDLRGALFRAAGIVRIYTKKPGQPPDLSKPYTIREGATVVDVVKEIHKDFVKRLKYVRLWGSGKFQGQQVPLDHVVQDKDVVEIRLS